MTDGTPQQVSQPQPAPAVVSPIADLSYRNYTGPLHARAFRWWIVALANIRLTLKNKWFWVLATGALIPYLWYGVFFYFSNQALSQPRGDAPPMLSLLDPAGGPKYTMVFFRAFSGFEQTWLFGIALLVGAGIIASDNRANALLVYLSKPITKGDYLLGKWFGIFLPVAAAAMFPMLLLYAFLGMAFSGQGFFTDEQWLLPRIVLTSLIPGAVHASLLAGISAWSRTSRLAGATYAGLFFATSIVVGILWTSIYGGNPAKGVLLQHMSVSGLIIGLGQNALGLKVLKPVLFHRQHGLEMPVIHVANAWVLLAVAAAICAVALLAARWRIRAVEVVKG